MHFMIATNTALENDQKEIAELKSSKRALEKRIQAYQFQWWVAICYIVACGLLGFCYSLLKPGYSNISERSIPPVILGSVFGLFVYSYVVFFMRTRMENSLRRIEFQLSKYGSDVLKETLEDNFFTKLVQINFKYLDQYYLQTQEQAEKSFRLSVFVSIAGFIIVVIGIIIIYVRGDDKTAGYVTTGAGILGQFISAVFFYLYNQTIIKMSQYHQKLVLTQNISLALKITDDMDKEAKSRSLEILIDRLTTDINKYLVDTNE